MDAARANNVMARQEINFEMVSGALAIRNDTPLEPTWETTSAALAHWAASTPDAVFLAERTAEGWAKTTYAEAAERVATTARKLISLGCSQARPLAIVSENTTTHAILALAAMDIGVPVSPISVAYATIASDFSRLQQMLETVTPAAIYFGDPTRCVPAIAAAMNIAPILADNATDIPGVRLLSDIEEVDPATVASLRSGVGPETVSKLMFTSGSTGKPKAVINTQQMICSNQAMLRTVWPILRDKPPVLVDWLPWTHTFGANFTFNLALFNGGALYIDGGKPVPHLIGQTIRNLEEIQPTVYFNVPAGFDALLGELRQNHALASRIFSRMDFVFFAAAALPQSVRDEMRQLIRDTTGRDLPFYTGWGSTETAPCATATWWETGRSDNIGLPLPGVEVRLIPDGDKLELQVRGSNVTPGYWRGSGLSDDAVDAAGFYSMGDAGVLIDPDNPVTGIKFDGRVSENFKLLTGTWVNVGELRINLVDIARPLVSDVVVTGSGRSEIGLLVFVNHAACRQLLGAAAQELNDPGVAGHARVREAIEEAIQRYNGMGRGSSSRVARFLILSDRPQISSFEITDKNYINQRAVLSNRSDMVDLLYTSDLYLV